MPAAAAQLLRPRLALSQGGPSIARDFGPDCGKGAIPLATVIGGLVPPTHEHLALWRLWVRGTGPRMTIRSLD